MHSVRISSQLLVSVLFIAVPTDTENFYFSYTCIYLHAFNTINMLTCSAEAHSQAKLSTYDVNRLHTIKSWRLMRT